jgi:hypothetical protein
MSVVASTFNPANRYNEAQPSHTLRFSNRRTLGTLEFWSIESQPALRGEDSSESTQALVYCIVVLAVVGSSCSKSTSAKRAWRPR